MIVNGLEIPTTKNNFVPKKVVVQTASGKSSIELTYPGRHYAASFPAVAISKYQVQLDADFQLFFDKDIRLYTVYLTTETPKHLVKK